MIAPTKITQNVPIKANVSVSKPTATNTTIRKTGGVSAPTHIARGLFA